MAILPGFPGYTPYPNTHKNGLRIEFSVSARWTEHKEIALRSLGTHGLLVPIVALRFLGMGQQLRLGETNTVVVSEAAVSFRKAPGK